MSQTPPTSVPASAPRFCRRCGYDLHAQTSPRCPECGQAFDPADPKTFRASPIRRGRGALKRAACGLLALALLLAALWGGLFWGWQSEQRALARLGSPAPADVVYKPLSPWLRRHAGPPGFVLDRVARLCLSDTRITDLTPLAGLKELRALLLSDTPITDLTPLVGLKELRLLSLSGTGVTDLAPLAGLTKLQALFLFDPITDLTPLAGLTELQYLSLTGDRITDLTPLAGLKELQHLYLKDTRITDLTPLTGLTKLKTLDLRGTAVTAAQVAALQRALPHCSIDYTPSAPALPASLPAGPAPRPAARPARPAQRPAPPAGR